MGDNLISWTPTNWITVTIMAVTGLLAVYALGQVFHWTKGAVTGGTTGAGAGSGAPVTNPAWGTSNNA